MRRISSILLLVASVSIVSHAQLLDSHGEEVTPYYLSFDTPLLTSIQDIRGEFLNVSYRDVIGESETITLTITDSKRKLVKELN